MKKLFAATLAAILILSAAGCAKKPVQQEEPAAPVQEEAIVPEAPAEAEKSQDMPGDNIRRECILRKRRPSRPSFPVSGSRFFIRFAEKLRYL